MTSTISSAECATQVPYVVREAEAARLLGISIRLLRKWRQKGGGPRVGKLSGAVIYRVSDLTAFGDASITHQEGA